MKIGSFINGGFSPFPSTAYTGLGIILQPGQIYEARITTDQMTPEKEAQNISNLMTLKIPCVSIIGVEAKGDTIRIQMVVTPSLAEGQVVSTFIIEAITVIIWPIVALIFGSVFVTRIGEIAWTVIILGGIGIAAYMLMNPKKKVMGGT